MQAWSGQPPVNDGGRHRCSGNGFAGATGILRANVTMDEETGRLDVQLFADVFADLDEITATGTTGAGFWLVTMFNAGNSGGKELRPVRLC
jgi:hypothetical protein